MLKYLPVILILFLSCSTQPEGCDTEYTEINGKCYYQGDIDVLQGLIDSSSTTITMTLDTDTSGTIEPLELQPQKWNDNGRLTLLWLYDDTLSGGIPENIGDLIYLNKLNLAFNQITGHIPESIGKLVNLDYLYLYDNELSGNIPASICNIFPIKYFWIEFNHFCPPYPECILEDDIHPQDTSQCP